MIVFHSGHISKYGAEVTMAAKKKILRSSKEPRLEQCDGTDCGNGWCCNNPSYSLCCPACDDGTQYCAGDDDDCPDCAIKNIRNMAADKKMLRTQKTAAKKEILRPSKKLTKEGCDGTDCGNGMFLSSYNFARIWSIVGEAEANPKQVPGRIGRRDRVRTRVN